MLLTLSPCVLIQISVWPWPLGRSGLDLEFWPQPWRLGLVVLTLTSASEFWPWPWRLGLVVLASPLKTRPRGSGLDLDLGLRVLASTLKTRPHGCGLDLKSFGLNLEDSASWFWPWPQAQSFGLDLEDSASWFWPQPWRLGLVVLILTSASEFWPRPWRLGLVVLASTLALASAFWPCLTSPDKAKKALFGDQKISCFDNTGSH